MIVMLDRREGSNGFNSYNSSSNGSCFDYSESTAA
jgi:hypothetical protein